MKKTLFLEGKVKVYLIGPCDAEILVDTRVSTATRVQANRPDIIVHDKKRRKSTIIEVGITSQDNLQTVEITKLHKYDHLAGEIGRMYKHQVEIIPYVLTWDGIVTRHHRKYVARLELPPNVEAYIQSRVIRRTLEGISVDRRRGLFDEGDGDRPEMPIAD